MPRTNQVPNTSATPPSPERWLSARTLRAARTDRIGAPARRDAPTASPPIGGTMGEFVLKERDGREIADWRSWMRPKERNQRRGG